ncbi:MAG: RluA family pseudouridine synthase [Planctomycetota bacterium]|jgi:tRNA pseudouridine32 synthase/23S rRNA pseudouridine746 synthase
MNPPDVLYRDEHLVVLSKPPGVLSVPGIGPQNQDCLVTRVATMLGGPNGAAGLPKVVHRLDRETSGVIVMALDAEAHRQLSRQFEQRTVHKRYIAVVHGVAEADSGAIELPMRKDRTPGAGPRHMIDHEQGRAARTLWRVLERYHDRTRLELEPITGRSHQLRLHLKSIGHPILGDDLYAPPPVVAISGRLLLHAESLSFTHPATGRAMTVDAPCPF